MRNSPLIGNGEISFEVKSTHSYFLGLRLSYAFPPPKPQTTAMPRVLSPTSAGVKDTSRNVRSKKAALSLTQRPAVLSMWKSRNVYFLLSFAVLPAFLYVGGRPSQFKCGTVTSSNTGHSKKVISYTLFSPEGASVNDTGELDWLVQSALQNIADSKLYYPGWRVRLYTFGLSPAHEKLLLGAADNVELVRCDLDSVLAASASRKMIARFLVFDDKNVDIAISRDLDSRIGPRELLAVNEWISSGMGFHVMRDHEYHTVPILGGMFGMLTRKLAKEHTTSMSTLLKQALYDNNGPIKWPDVPGEDQAFLAAYVWPLFRDDALSHDVSLARCREYGAKSCRDFPRILRDADNFIGAAHKLSGCESLRWRCDGVCTT